MRVGRGEHHRKTDECFAIDGELHYHEAPGRDIFRIGDLPLLSLPFLRRIPVRCKLLLLSFCFFAATAFAQQPQGQTAPAGTGPGNAPNAAQVPVEPTLPYIPSLDVTAMDRSVDPCVDFYQYSCGGWQQKNPIPADQVRWDVYSKLYEDNLAYLRGILEQASTAKDHDAVTQKIGDYYAACMDEPAVEKLGAMPMQPALDQIQAIKSVHDLRAGGGGPSSRRRFLTFRQRFSARSR